MPALGFVGPFDFEKSRSALDRFGPSRMLPQSSEVFVEAIQQAGQTFTPTAQRERDEGEALVPDHLHERGAKPPRPRVRTGCAKAVMAETRLHTEFFRIGVVDLEPSLDAAPAEG